MTAPLPIQTRTPIVVVLAELGGREVTVSRITGRTARLFHAMKEDAANPERLWEFAASCLPGLTRDEVDTLEIQSVQKLIWLATADWEAVEEAVKRTGASGGDDGTRIELHDGLTYLLARVARGFSQSPEAVADWSLADVVLWDAALAEVERVESVRREAESLVLASYVALAFHNPKDLQGAEVRWRRTLALPVPIPAAEVVQEVVTDLAEQWALTARVARRKLRSGVPLTDAERFALGH